MLEMAGFGGFDQILDALACHMKKLEEEIKCPACSKLFSSPTTLPCTHMFCSDCVITLNLNGSPTCPVCHSTFFHGELRATAHMEKVVNIYKDVEADIRAILQQRGPHVFGERDGLAASGAKTCTQNAGNRDFVNQDGQNSPPSPSSMEADYENNDQGAETAFGPMMCYHNGKLVAADEEKQSNAIYVHLKCGERASKVHYFGGNIFNLEVEPEHASAIRCSKCKLKGAALGCYVESGSKNFHVPCALTIPGYQWDCENLDVCCPAHSSQELQCGKSNNRKGIEDNRSSSPQMDCSSSQEELIAEHQNNELQTATPGVNDERVYIGSDLSLLEKDLLNNFVGLTGASVTEIWRDDVTHVIASTSENGACKRTYKVLMAILRGKWVLKIGWIKACMEAKHLVSEEPYEIRLDVYGYPDGPRKGRIRARGVPKLFTEISFYFSNEFMPSYRACLQDLVVAAGGTVLKECDLIPRDINPEESSITTFLVYNEDQSPRRAWTVDFIKKCGAQIIGHKRILDAIAACSIQFLKEESQGTRCLPW